MIVSRLRSDGDHIPSALDQAKTKTAKQKNFPMRTSMFSNFERFIHECRDPVYMRFTFLPILVRVHSLLPRFPKSQAEMLTLYKDIRDSVIHRADVLLVTDSFAGSKLAKQFPATFLLQDESAMNTMPGSLIPWMAYPKVDGGYLFRDEKQNTAVLANPEANGFSEVLGMSLFAVLIKKNHPRAIILTTQYRTVPECQEFISREWYDDQLVCNTDKAANSSRYTTIVREYAGTLALAESAYFGVNVMRGIQTHEGNNPFIQNWANVEAFKTIVEYFTDKGVDPKDIYYLTYYKAQKDLIPPIFNGNTNPVGGWRSGKDVRSKERAWERQPGEGRL